MQNFIEFDKGEGSKDGIFNYHKHIKQQEKCVKNPFSSPPDNIRKT